MRRETRLRGDTSLLPPPGPLIDDPVELLVELPHGFALLDSERFHLIAQALICSFLVQFSSFQACDVVLHGVICRHPRCRKTSYGDNSSKGQRIRGRAATPLRPLLAIVGGHDQNRFHKATTANRAAADKTAIDMAAVHFDAM